MPVLKISNGITFDWHVKRSLCIRSRARIVHVIPRKKEEKKKKTWNESKRVKKTWIWITSSFGIENESSIMWRHLSLVVSDRRVVAAEIQKKKKYALAFTHTFTHTNATNALPRNILHTMSRTKEIFFVSAFLRGNGAASLLTTLTTLTLAH